MDLVESHSAVAQRHPWELARAEFFLGQIGRLPRRATICDIGSGDAWFAEQVLQRFPESTVVAWDINYSDEILATPRPGGLTLTREDPGGTFDVVLLMDVIEHVEDDVALLQKAKERMGSQGVLLLSVPAWQKLFGPHDVHLGHYRRYSFKTLSQSFSSAGLNVEQIGGLFHALLPIRLLQNALTRSKQEERTAVHSDLGEWNRGAFATRAIASVFRSEGSLSRRAAAAGRRLPGLSIWAMATGPDAD